MELKLLRYSSDESSTIGLLFIDGKFFCYTLEDEYRKIKVRHQTRIPQGSYEIKLRKEKTPLTIKYQARYPWFSYHIEITNVLGFKGIYFHVGNTDIDTSGCILLGYTTNQYNDQGEKISRSKQSFENFYKLVQPVLESSSQAVILNIYDLDRNFSSIDFDGTISTIDLDSEANIDVSTTDNKELTYLLKPTTYSRFNTNPNVT